MFDKYIVLELEDGTPFGVGYVEKENMIVADLRLTPFEDFEDRVKNGYRFLVQHKDILADIVKRFDLIGEEGFYIAGGF